MTIISVTIPTDCGENVTVRNLPPSKRIAIRARHGWIVMSVNQAQMMRDALTKVIDETKERLA